MKWLARWKLKKGAQLNFNQTTALLGEVLGTRINSGPFAGMNYIDVANGSVWWAKIIGTYECELEPVMNEVFSRKYDVIIDVGCAEGYYAVGLAYKTNAVVHAFDINPDALINVKRLAELNKLTSRVHVSGKFDPSMLNQFQNQKVFLICDIEGAEKDLLDPEVYPQLREVDVLVEVHDGHEQGEIDQVLRTRFDKTHEIRQIVYNRNHPSRRSALPDVAARHVVKSLTEEGRKLGVTWLYLKRR